MKNRTLTNWSIYELYDVFRYSQRSDWAEYKEVNLIDGIFFNESIRK